MFQGSLKITRDNRDKRKKSLKAVPVLGLLSRALIRDKANAARDSRDNSFRQSAQQCASLTWLEQGIAIGFAARSNLQPRALRAPPLNITLQDQKSSV